MNNANSFLTKDNALLLAYGVLLQVISKGSALFSFTFNIDDIIFWSMEYSYDTLLSSAIRDGRFMLPFLAWWEQLLGINPPLSFTVSTLIFMVCISTSAILVCHIWGVERNRWASIIVIGFISLHPYLTDFFTWRIATFNGGLPFVFALISLIAGGRSTRLMPLAIILFSLSLGIHQIPLQFCATTIACAALFLLLRYTGAIESDFQKNQLRIEIYRLLRMLVVLIAGSLIYAILAKFYIAYGGIETLGRDKIILIENPLLVLSRISELFSLWTLSDPLVSPLNRLFFIVFLAIFVFSVFRKNLVFTKKIISVLSVPFLLTLAALGAIGLTVVPIAWIPVFRNMFSISLIWSAVAVFAYLAASRYGRNLSVGLICLLFIAFAAKDNEMLTDQMRANQRDISMMNRIAGDIEKLSNFKEMHSLVFIGTNSSSLRGLRSAADLSNGWNSYGTTLSLFAIPWQGYMASFLYQITGYEFRQENDLVKFKAACSNKYWPSDGSVFSISTTVVVCLGGTGEMSFSPLDARYQGVDNEKK